MRAFDGILRGEAVIFSETMGVVSQGGEGRQTDEREKWTWRGITDRTASLCLANDELKVDKGVSTLAVEGDGLAAGVVDEVGAGEGRRGGDCDLVFRGVEDELSGAVKSHGHDGGEGQGMRS